MANILAQHQQVCIVMVSMIMLTDSRAVDLLAYWLF